VALQNENCPSPQTLWRTALALLERLVGDFARHVRLACVCIKFQTGVPI